MIIRSTMKCRLDDDSIETSWRYTSSAPWEVNFTAEGVTWVFARDLLLGGGIGDVVVSVDGPATTIHLRSCEGEATLEFLTSDIKSFLRSITAKVPFGAEETFQQDWEYLPSWL